MLSVFFVSFFFLAVFLVFLFFRSQADKLNRSRFVGSSSAAPPTEHHALSVFAKPGRQCTKSSSIGTSRRKKQKENFHFPRRHIKYEPLDTITHLAKKLKKKTARSGVTVQPDGGFSFAFFRIFHEYFRYTYFFEFFFFKGDPPTLGPPLPSSQIQSHYEASPPFHLSLFSYICCKKKYFTVDYKAEECGGDGRGSCGGPPPLLLCWLDVE